jgi:polar amino acid transport system substrate-binding protein
MRFAFLQEPPFCFTDKAGKVLGCDVELAQAVCDELGITDFEPVESEFAELLPGLAAGRWTMTTGLFITAERARIVDFTRPTWSLSDGLLVRKGNPLGISGYRSIAADPNVTLGVITDQIQHRTALENGVPPERITLFATQAEVAEAVAGGAVDAYASVAMAHRGYLARWPDVPLEVVDVPTMEKQPAFGAFALAKSNGELRRRIDLCLGDLLGSAWHRSMMQSYGFADSDVGPVL